MTLIGFCALAALVVAWRTPGEPGGTGEAPAGAEELAALQRELFAVRNAVNRTGVNLNQAVARLNATGQSPVWLEHAVNRVVQAAAEVDAVVAQLHRRWRELPAVIPAVHPCGARVGGLLRYLLGPGAAAAGQGQPDCRPMSRWLADNSTRSSLSSNPNIRVGRLRASAFDG